LPLPAVIRFISARRETRKLRQIPFLFAHKVGNQLFLIFTTIGFIKKGSQTGSDSFQFAFAAGISMRVLSKLVVQQQSCMLIRFVILRAFSTELSESFLEYSSFHYGETS
jgi:hypothetical protein